MTSINYILVKKSDSDITEYEHLTNIYYNVFNNPVTLIKQITVMYTIDVNRDDKYDEIWIKKFHDLDITVEYEVCQSPYPFYDQWLIAYERYPSYDYYIFGTYEYVLTPNFPDFGRNLVNYYKKITKDNIGYLCTYASDKFKLPYHTVLPEGIISKDTLEKIGDYPLNLYYNIKDEYCFYNNKLKFCSIFPDSKKYIVDFSNKWSAVDWNDTTKIIVNYSNVSIPNYIFIPYDYFPNINVSVIIPTFNRYKYLIDAINSVISQTHKNIEIIIINDGSTDENYYNENLEKFLPSNTKLINFAYNSGKIVGIDGRAAYARNQGLKVATGNYISFLDDDDVWLPDKLSLQLQYMFKYQCGMCSTEGLVGKGVYNPNGKYPKYLSEYHNNFLKSKNIDKLPLVWDKNFLASHNYCITSSVIIEKKFVKKSGFMIRKRVGEDYDYWLKILTHTNNVFISEPLVYYNNNHGDGQLY